MIPSPWETATVDISVDANLSTEVDLGKPYEFLTVLIPTITNSTVTVHISESAGGTYFPLYVFDSDATGDFTHATSAATTTHAITFWIGGVRYVKVNCGSTQTTTDKVFKVRGFNRE